MATRGARLDHLYSSSSYGIFWGRRTKEITSNKVINSRIWGLFPLIPELERVDLGLGFPSNLAGHVTWLGAHHPGQPPHCLLLSRQAGFNKKSDRTDLTGG